MGKSEPRMIPVEANLFDVLDVDGFSPVREMTICPVSRRDVEEMCRRWHYAGRGGNMTWNYGLFDGFTCVGVVSYNLPTRPACAAVMGEKYLDQVAHMGRLVCAEDAPRNVESRLIAGSLKQFHADNPIYRVVVTFAATGQGHLGYVYQATNAIYAGMSDGSHYYIDEAGTRRAPKQGRNLSMDKALARGWTIHHEPGKHRYLYLLGNKTRRNETRALLRFPSLPYPKENGTPKEQPDA